tara:strand:- start:187 stop:423 length:237 start_codon:yes stop_codon:yes gene_type:complete
MINKKLGLLVIRCFVNMETSLVHAEPVLQNVSRVKRVKFWKMKTALFGSCSIIMENILALLIVAKIPVLRWPILLPVI